MNVKDFTYTELNKMFGELVEKHCDDTDFFCAESAKKYADDELVSGDYIGVQNAFDELSDKVEGMEIFDWSCGIDGNSYDVGLIHNDCYDYADSVRMAMVFAECLRRNIDVDVVKEFFRIMKEMQCVKI